jgi:hypothetical protein
MIKKYICENLNVVMIYCKMKIYSKKDSNNNKTWWNTWSYIEYELIVLFQPQLKSLIQMILQKTYGQVFHLSEHNCVEKKHFVEKLLSFKRWQELCWRPLYQNPFFMFFKMLDEIKEKVPPKHTPKKKYFLA